MWGEDAGIDINLAQKAENYHNEKKEYMEKLTRVSLCSCDSSDFIFLCYAMFLQNASNALPFQEKAEKKLKKDMNDRNKYKKGWGILSRK